LGSSRYKVFQTTSAAVQLIRAIPMISQGARSSRIAAARHRQKPAPAKRSPVDR
jgi:hypothetical protein